QLVDDERVRQPLEDLTFTLVLAILVGLVAAVALAGVVARGLARPVAALRDAAVALGRGAPLPAFPPGALREFEPVVSAFERIAEREFDLGGRQIRVQIASLGPAPDGCVVALDDATAFTRAARVLAWGEMARQVAHEIKNPLTPIRLGVQHLRRARAEGRAHDFDATLEDTAARILAEIDRLDAIARAFSRFASPQAEQLPLEPVDLYAAAREVVQLYALGGTEAPTRFEMAGEAGTPALA